MEYWWKDNWQGKTEAPKVCSTGHTETALPLNTGIPSRKPVLWQRNSFTRSNYPFRLLISCLTINHAIPDTVLLNGDTGGTIR